MKKLSNKAALICFMMIAAAAWAEPLAKDDAHDGSMRWVLEAPTHVESFRLKTAQPDAPAADPPSKRIGTYVIDHVGPDLTPEQVAAAVKLIVDPAVHGKASNKLCDPQPGVAFRFTRDKHVFEIAICFECSIWIEFVDDKRIAMEDFDPVRSPLAKLVKALFPKDAALANIDDK
jgi:hypothetical protein